MYVNIIRLCIIDKDGYFVKSTWGNHPKQEIIPLKKGQEYVISATPRDFNKPKWNGCGWVETDFSKPNPRDEREEQLRKQAALEANERETILHLRAFVLGKHTEQDITALAKLEAEATELQRGIELSDEILQQASRR
jgi:hypothetical protein